MCGTIQYPYPPQERSFEILRRVAGGLESQHFKKKYEVKQISRGMGVQTQKTSVVGYGYFLEQHNIPHDLPG